LNGIGVRPRLNVVQVGAGPAFVFQHGLCGDAGQPGEVFPSESGYRLVTVECRGHGLSDAGRETGFSIATFAEDVVYEVETEVPLPAVFGGISLGAAIALRIAVSRPELVRALVLARPAWVTEAAPANMRPYVEVGELLARHSPEEACRRFEGSSTASRLRREAPDNLASLTGFFSRQPHDVTSTLLQRIASDGPGVSRQQIRRLAVPTLVIGHAKDEVHPFHYAEMLASLIPGAQLATITPKTESRSAYVADFRKTLARFLYGLDQN